MNTQESASPNLNCTSSPSPIVSTEVSPSQAMVYTPEPTPYEEPYTTIIIGSTGDIMAHLSQIADAQYAAEGEHTFTTEGNELYSFDHWFEYIKPSLEYADLMIGNLETTIASDNSLVSGYPFFAAPKEILPALKSAGFDVLVNANNHMLDKEQTGLISTVTSIDEADIFHTGAWTSLESKNTPLIIDVKGVKVGIVSATTSLNDQEKHLSSDEQEYMYTLASDLDDMYRQIKNCRDSGADLVVVCPHWGYQYEIYPNAGQISLAEEYIKMGADIILAHHPHVLQPVDILKVECYDGTEREGVVFWSLGNFVSSQMSKIETVSGAIAYVTITVNNETGQFTIDDVSYLPVWTYIEYSSETDSKSYCVLPVGEILDNPELISGLTSRDLSRDLEKVWNLVTNRLGTSVAQPLRTVPIS
ncbi:MAG: CapA family protein [Clostridia bacterium]|nr:CapA family protein [Clostridia bacterium]